MSLALACEPTEPTGTLSKDKDSDLGIYNCTEFDCYETVKNESWPGASDGSPAVESVSPCMLLVHGRAILGVC